MTSFACACGAAMHLHGESADPGGHIAVAWRNAHANQSRLEVELGSEPDDTRHEPVSVAEAHAIRMASRGGGRKVHAPAPPPYYTLCAGYGTHITSDDPAEVTCAHCLAALA